MPTACKRKFSFKMITVKTSVRILNPSMVILIYLDFQRNLVEEKILTFDSVKFEDSRSIVFDTQQNLEMLKKS